MRRYAVVTFAVGLVAVACSAAPGSISSTTTAADSGESIDGAPIFVTAIEEAVTVGLAAREDRAAVAWITHDEVSVATLDLASGRLTDATRVNGQLTPIAHPIERPAVRVSDDGVDVAFTSFNGDGATVYLAEGLGDPTPISGPPRPETNLVHMASAPDGTRLLTWLEDATVSVARTIDGALVEDEEVDDLTCDCCNPVPAFVDESMVVAYRDFDTVDGEIVRNVASVRSTDGGGSYEPPVQIADDDWFLSGCPFSGPDIVEIDGALVVAWMDARQALHPDQTDSTIWIDRSDDGGATYGVDQSVATGGRHSWPVMTVDDSGIIHLIWETRGPEGGLSYAWSADGGETFSEPRLIVDRELSEGGAPASPSVTHHDGHVLVTWADGRRGYVAAWSTAK